MVLKSIKHDDDIYVNLNDLILFFLNHEPNKEIMLSKNSIVETLTKYKINIESKKDSDNLQNNEQTK